MLMIKILKYILASSILVALIAGLGFKYNALSTRSLSYSVSSLVYPLLKIEQALVAPFAKIFMHYRQYRQADATSALYKKLAEELQARLITIQDYVRYSTDIQELRAYAHRYDNCVQIAAQILVRNFDEESHFMLIDAGSRKGVTVDSAVVYKNCLIGRITHVYPAYSRVLLITDKRCSLGAYCATTGAKGVHEGINNRMATELNFVNHLDTINKNDLVLSVGEGSVFPRGFGLGRIVSFQLNGFYYSITLEPLIDIAQLSYCSVIQKGNVCMSTTCETAQQMQQQI